MNLDDILEKIKRIDNSSSSNNIVYFIVACDLLYFLKDNDKRERFIHEYYKNDTNMFTNNFKKVCYYAESILLEDEPYIFLGKLIYAITNRQEVRVSSTNIACDLLLELVNLILDEFKVERIDKIGK